MNKKFSVKLVIFLLLSSMLVQVPTSSNGESIISNDTESIDLDSHNDENYTSFNYETAVISNTLHSGVITSVEIEIEVSLTISHKVDVFLALTDDLVTLDDVLNGTANANNIIYPKYAFQGVVGPQMLSFSVEGDEFYKTYLQNEVNIHLIFGFTERSKATLDISDPIGTLDLDYTKFSKPSTLINRESLSFSFYNSSGNPVSQDCKCIKVVEVSFDFELIRDIDSYTSYVNLYGMNYSDEVRSVSFGGTPNQWSDMYTEKQAGDVISVTSKHIISTGFNYSLNLTAHITIEYYGLNATDKYEFQTARYVKMFDHTFANGSFIPFQYQLELSTNGEPNINSEEKLEWLDYYVNFELSDNINLNSMNVADYHNQFVYTSSLRSMTSGISIGVPVFHPDLPKDDPLVFFSFYFTANVLGESYSFSKRFERTLNMSNHVLASNPVSNVELNYNPVIPSDSTELYAYMDITTSFSYDYQLRDQSSVVVLSGIELLDNDNYVDYGYGYTVYAGSSQSLGVQNFTGRIYGSMFHPEGLDQYLERPILIKSQILIHLDKEDSSDPVVSMNYKEITNLTPADFNSSYPLEETPTDPESEDDTAIEESLSRLTNFGPLSFSSIILSAGAIVTLPLIVRRKGKH